MFGMARNSGSVVSPMLMAKVKPSDVKIAVRHSGKNTWEIKSNLLYENIFVTSIISSGIFESAL